ncbi:MAG: hypothetical protein JRC99_00010 [Deltaproteobacteria bacterium]|nr:hypothetical protein [Deltaproteobacteria bacterium]
MSESPSATWTAETDEQSDSSLFTFAAIDEVASQFNRNDDLLQNATAYLIVQHDPSIQVTRIVPSTGSMGSTQSPKPVTRAQSERNTFYSGANTYDLKFIPTGLVSGFWWFDPPSTKGFNEAGTPPKTTSGRKVTVDIDNFGKPCQAMIEYNATFNQYPYYPPSTDFEDSSVVWPVAFTIFYKRVP